MGSINRAAVVIAAAIAVTACAPGQSGRPGEYQAGYNQGKFTTVFAGDVLAVYRASVKALTDLGMTIRKSDKNYQEAIIEATRPDDMLPVTIRYRAEGADTVASIQVGPNGEEHYSRVIAKRITARLKG